ncbi:hypothetical protein [Photobacterium leiognathi]|uniref:hypothetical protein n=1 Tax=Photobacterium leiognathi TaxID=553611 RepID=UPI002981B1F2|nr:hypothetical protein [Photobacterium leiognathi]
MATSNENIKARCRNGSGSDAVKIAHHAVEGLTLMIITFGKAQTMDENPHKYEDLTTYWGKFIDTMMEKVKNEVKESENQSINSFAFFR